MRARGDPAVRLPVHDSAPRPLEQLLRDARAVVAGAVVDHDDLEVFVRLRSDRFQRLTNESLPVVDGNDHAHHGRHSGKSATDGYSPAVTDPLLASLLMEHPFADDEGLLFTIDRSITAGEARAAARALADELIGLGVRPGSAVAVALPNGPEVVITMTAVWLAGGVFVPVNPRYPAAEVDRVLDATEPAAVIGVDGSDAARDRARATTPVWRS